MDEKDSDLDRNAKTTDNNVAEPLRGDDFSEWSDVESESSDDECLERSELVKISLETLIEDLGYVYKANLGNGTYGDVYRMCDPTTHQDVALKLVTYDNVTDNEIRLWPLLNHVNILPLLDVFSLESLKMVIFQMPVQRYSLHDILTDKWAMALSNIYAQVKKWLFQVLSAFEYLAQKNLCHLDLKVDNILISKSHTAMLCDFSFLNNADKPVKRNDLGLPYIYRPPESCTSLGEDIVVDGVAYDMWSYGILVVEIFTDYTLALKIRDSESWIRDIYPVLYRTLEKEKFTKLLRRTFKRSQISDEEVDLALNFIQSFLVFAPNFRTRASTALWHTFLGNGKWVSTYFEPLFAEKSTEDAADTKSSTHSSCASSEIIEDKDELEQAEDTEAAGDMDTESAHTDILCESLAGEMLVGDSLEVDEVIGIKSIECESNLKAIREKSSSESDINQKPSNRFFLLGRHDECASDDVALKDDRLKVSVSEPTMKCLFRETETDNKCEEFRKLVHAELPEVNLAEERMSISSGEIENRSIQPDNLSCDFVWLPTKTENSSDVTLIEVFGDTKKRKRGVLSRWMRKKFSKFQGCFNRNRSMEFE